MSLTRFIYTSKRYVSKVRSVPLRDFLEWINLPNVIKKNENFFIDYHTTLKKDILSPHFRTLNSVFDNSLTEYHPDLAQSLAKSLLVDYKLNEYPYYDLTVLNIFTNSEQAMKILGEMMDYLNSELSSSMMERIRIFMVPLYKLPPQERRKLQETYNNDNFKSTHHIEIITDSSIFESAESLDGITDIDASLAIQGHVVVDDPVHVVLFNDVLENLSHDLVRRSGEHGHWEQCYIDIHENGSKTKRFQPELDPLCQQTIDHLILNTDDYRENSGADDIEVYIPTQIVNLFNVLRYRVPEHKLFAVDMFQPPSNTESIWSRVKAFLLSPLSGQLEQSQSSTLVLGYNECHHKNNTTQWHRALKFIPNPRQLQKLYTSVNEGRKICDIEPLDLFISNWNGKKSSNNKSLYVMHSNK